MPKPRSSTSGISRRNLILGALPALALVGYGAKLFLASMTLESGVARMVRDIFSPDILSEAELSKFSRDFARHLKRHQGLARRSLWIGVSYSQFASLMDGVGSAAELFGQPGYSEEHAALKRIVATGFIRSTNYATRGAAKPLAYVGHIATPRNTGCVNTLARFDFED